jgi:hypothetical protein
VLYYVGSIGCTFIEMASGRPPWSEFNNPMATMFHIANTNQLPALPDAITDEAKHFICTCLQRDPAARPSATLLLSHPFVTGGTLADLPHEISILLPPVEQVQEPQQSNNSNNNQTEDHNTVNNGSYYQGSAFQSQHSQQSTVNLQVNVVPPSVTNSYANNANNTTNNNNTNDHNNDPSAASLGARDRRISVVRVMSDLPSNNSSNQEHNSADLDTNSGNDLAANINNINIATGTASRQTSNNTEEDNNQPEFSQSLSMAHANYSVSNANISPTNHNNTDANTVAKNGVNNLTNTKVSDKVNEDTSASPNTNKVRVTRGDDISRSTTQITKSPKNGDKSNSNSTGADSSMISDFLQETFKFKLAQLAEADDMIYQSFREAVSVPSSPANNPQLISTSNKNLSAQAQAIQFNVSPHGSTNDNDKRFNYTVPTNSNNTTIANPTTNTNTSGSFNRSGKFQIPPPVQLPENIVKPAIHTGSNNSNPSANNNNFNTGATESPGYQVSTPYPALHDINIAHNYNYALDQTPTHNKVASNNSKNNKHNFRYSARANSGNNSNATNNTQANEFVSSDDEEEINLANKTPNNPVPDHPTINQRSNSGDSSHYHNNNINSSSSAPVSAAVSPVLNHSNSNLSNRVNIVRANNNPTTNRNVEPQIKRNLFEQDNSTNMNGLHADSPSQLPNRITNPNSPNNTANLNSNINPINGNIAVVTDANNPLTPTANNFDESEDSSISSSIAEITLNKFAKPKQPNGTNNNNPSNVDNHVYTNGIVHSNAKDSNTDSFRNKVRVTRGTTIVKSAANDY